jgi:hypothetical protein
MVSLRSQKEAVAELTAASEELQQENDQILAKLPQ